MAQNKKFFQKPNRKVTVQLGVALVAFLAAVLGFNFDPEQSAVASQIIGFLAGYIVKE